MEKSPESPTPEAHRSNDNQDPTEPNPSKDADEAVTKGRAPGEMDTAAPPSSPVPPEQGSRDDATDTPDAAADGKQDAPVRNENLNLDMILEIPLEITVELGRTQMPISKLLQLGPGSAVPLSKLEGEPVDIMANDRLIAKGIVLVKDEKYGIQITEITGRLNRLRGLR